MDVLDSTQKVYSRCQIKHIYSIYVLTIITAHVHFVLLFFAS